MNTHDDQTSNVRRTLVKALTASPLVLTLKPNAAAARSAYQCIANLKEVQAFDPVVAAHENLDPERSCSRGRASSDDCYVYDKRLFWVVSLAEPEQQPREHLMIVQTRGPLGELTGDFTIVADLLNGVDSGASSLKGRFGGGGFRPGQKLPANFRITMEGDVITKIIDDSSYLGSKRYDIFDMWDEEKVRPRGKKQAELDKQAEVDFQRYDIFNMNRWRQTAPAWDGNLLAVPAQPEEGLFLAYYEETSQSDIVEYVGTFPETQKDVRNFAMSHTCMNSIPNVQVREDSTLSLG